MPEETTNMSFGSRLQWAREQSGLSQGQAAKLMHLERSDLIALEEGRNGASPMLIDELTALYDVGTDWLKTGVEREFQGGVIIDAAPGGIDPDELRDVKTLFGRLRQDERKDP